MYFKYPVLHLDYGRRPVNVNSLLTDYISVSLKGRQVEGHDDNIYHSFLSPSHWVKSRASMHSGELEKS